MKYISPPTPTHISQQITKAVKLLRANHRLILSGTPIQVPTADRYPQLTRLTLAKTEYRI